MNPISSSTYPQGTEVTPNTSYPYSSNFQMMSPNYTTPSVTSPSNTDTITKEHIRLSILSAVEDKLKARSKEIVSQYSAEIDVLKKTGTTLMIID